VLMTAVLETLIRLPAPVHGAVVLVGAGDNLPADMLDKLHHTRLVLVEGDAEAAEALARQFAGHLAVQVLPTAVAPHDGPLTWNRHELASLNGPVDRQALRAFYPRLTRTESTIVPARALSEVLDPCLASAEADSVSALLLDVPGQEQALLASLSPQQLRRFEWIICRRCAALDGAENFEHLLAAGFALRDDDHESEPLWPVATLRFDAAAYALREATARCTELATARDAAYAQADEWRERAAVLQSELASTAQRAEEWRRQAETSEQLAQVTKHDLAAADERIAKTQQGQETADRLLAKAHAQVETLWHDKRELQATIDDQLVELETLRTHVHAASDQAATLRHSLDEELTRWRQRALEAENRLATNPAPEDPTVHAALERRVQELQAELHHQALRQQLLRDELNKAEGQVEIVKSLLLADMGL
jgi:hypothetical protein